MKPFLSFFVVFFYFSFLSRGQMLRGVQEFTIFEKRPLLVVLPQAEKEKEQVTIAEIQKNIIKNMSRFWQTQKEVTYMSPKEFRDLKKDKKNRSNYAVLYFTTLSVNSNVAEGGAKALDPNGWSNVFVMNLGLSEYAFNNIFTYRHNFASVTPSEAEMASTLLVVQNIIKKGVEEKELISFPKEAKTNAKKLKNLSLLLDEQQLEKVITEKEIKELYGLQYKIVSTKELEDAILQQVPGFAYVYMLPNSTRGKNLQLQLVLDTQKSEVVSVSMPPKFKVMGTHSGRMIGKRNLEEYASYISK